MRATNGRDVAFRAKVKQAGEVLAAAGLLAQTNLWPKYADLAKQVRKEPYRDEWAYYETQSLFDFTLVDGSLFQFKDEPEAHTDVSFCFYESPLAVDDFETFVVNTYGATLAELADVADLAEEEYEEYLSSAGLKRAVTAIRYDHSPGLYCEGRHPASHIHIGHGNQVRLCAIRVMNPVSFTLFVVRQVYPHHWEWFIKQNGVENYIRHVRETLSKVDAEYLKAKDDWEVYLT